MIIMINISVIIIIIVIIIIAIIIIIIIIIVISSSRLREMIENPGVMSHHVIPLRAMLCYVMSCHIMSYCG